MSTTTQPNLETMRLLYDAIAAGDVGTIEGLQAEGFTLTVAGRSAISGTFVGAEAGQQFQHSMELTQGQMRMEPQHLLADDRVGVAFLIVTARRPDGREIEQRLIHEVRFKDGKVAAIDEWIWDHHADEAFWS